MSTFQIKCYLFPEHVTATVKAISEANVEIRRFALRRESGAGMYKELLEKIKTGYSAMLPANQEESQLKTYWQDEENELVGMSSDADLQYALEVQTALQASSSKPYDHRASMIGNVFKVYIKVDSKHHHQHPHGHRHHHRAPMFGSPFGDFNSAAETSADEEKAVHPGVKCDGCQEGLVGRRYKCAECFDYDLCAKCKDKGIHAETKHKFNVIAKPFNIFAHGFPFGQPATESGSCPFGGRSGRGRRFGGRCTRNQQPNSAAGSAPPAPSTFPDHLQRAMSDLMGGMPIVNDPEQLKNVGECLKSFLDPFGIDVDYYVDSITKITKKQEAEKAKEAPKETNEKQSASTAAADLLTSSKIDDSSRPMDTTADPVLIPTPSTPLIDIKASAPSPFEQAASALKSVIENSNAAAVAAADVEAENKQKRLVDVAEEHGFNLVDIEKELKIIRTLELLKSMGYSDDGGWLTSLVMAKDGNINAVLDAFGQKN